MGYLTCPGCGRTLGKSKTGLCRCCSVHGAESHLESKDRPSVDVQFLADSDISEDDYSEDSRPIGRCGEFITDGDAEAVTWAK